MTTSTTSAVCPFAFPFPPDDDPTAPPAVPTSGESSRVVPIALPDRPDGRPADLVGSSSAAWYVTGYELVRRVLRETETFSREHGDDVHPYLRLSPLIMGWDGEHHRALRSLVAREFTPRRIALQRPVLEALTDRLLDAMAASGEPADLVEALAMPLSLHAVGEVLQTPEEDRGRFRQWGDMFISTGPDRAREAETALREMTAYVARRMERLGDRDDSALARTLQAADERGIDHAEAALLVSSMVTAAWETTAGALSCLLYKLLTTTWDGTLLYRHLCLTPDAIPGTIHETLRTVPNGTLETAQPRRAMRDVELDGVQVRAGDIVVPAIDQADRDPDVWDDPDRYDITRTPRPLLTFGHGPHVCLGEHLAVLELNVAVERLTTRFPALRLAAPPTEITWNAATTVRRPLALPVTWSSPATSQKTR
ncbi:cytochrome P450 [Actinomadura gamaensis]|uniref:Cytochrome P450 n=1 Tax=Actinomadura gamaensis TaxID=1763541 RepID=A0ABV9TVC2_9ACTN